MIKHIVTAILSHKNKILIVKRSQKVKTFPGQWSGIIGYLEKCDLNPYERTIIEINEETSIIINNFTLVKYIPKIDLSDNSEILWIVHPFLFNVVNPNITLNWENEKYKWILPNEITCYLTVPQLDLILSILLRNQ